MKINFGFHEFLYNLSVNNEMYRFLQELDAMKSVTISINFDTNGINQEKLDNFSRWQGRYSQDNHTLKVKRQVMNFFNSIEQQYYTIQQYAIEDNQICKALQLIISIYTQKYNKSFQQSYNYIISEINQSIEDNKFEILDIDLKNSIVIVEIKVLKKGDHAYLVNQTLNNYLEQFEIVEIKQEEYQSFHEPLIHQLCLEHKFAYIKEEKINRTEYPYQIDNFAEISKEISKGKGTDAEQNIDEDNNDNEGVEKSFILRKKGKYTKSLKQIALIIEQENFNKFREFEQNEQDLLEKIQFLTKEFQLGDKIFKQYDVLIEIEDNLINIYGENEGQELIDEMVDQVKQLQTFNMRSVNTKPALVESAMDDVEKENQILKKEKFQITLIGITFDVYNKIWIHSDDLSKESDCVKVSIMTFNSVDQQKDIFSDIFNEKEYFIQIENKFSEYQKQQLFNYGIAFSKYDQDTFKLICTKRKYDRFLTDFKEEAKDILIKKELEYDLIYLKMLMKNKKALINKLNQNCKFTIINEHLQESQHHQISLICFEKDYKKIVTKLNKYIKIVRDDVVKLDYPINESDLILFSKKGDDLMEYVYNQEVDKRDDQDEEEQDAQKNIEKGQIQLQYYLADINYEFSNNLIDLQRERNNNISKNFKMILEQNQITRLENDNNASISQSLEQIRECKHELSIQLISTDKNDEDILTLVKGSANTNIIIIDHQEDTHLKKFETLFKNEDRLYYYLQDEDKYSKFDSIKKQIQTEQQQQLCIKIREDNLQSKDQQKTETMLIMIGEGMLDPLTSIVNSQQLDQTQEQFLKPIFSKAMEEGIQIHIMIKSNSIRDKVLKNFLEVIETCNVQNINKNFSCLKVHFIKPHLIEEIPMKHDQKVKDLKRDKEMKIEEAQKQIKQANEDLQNTLVFFKEHQKKQQDKALEQRKTSASKWYFYENEIKVYEFKEQNSIIIDQYYRDFIKDKGDQTVSHNSSSLSSSSSQSKYYFIDLFKERITKEKPEIKVEINEKEDQWDDQLEEKQSRREEEIPDRSVILNILSNEVYFKFLNLNISLQLFFKFYPHIEKIIKSMKQILNQSQINEITLQATQKSAAQNQIKNLIFEDEIFEVLFNDDKYILQSVDNPHFQQYQQRQFLINRQSLVYEGEEVENRRSQKNEDVIIKYNFVRDELSGLNNDNSYVLKLLVEKKDKEKAEKNLKLFFDIKRNLFEKSKKNLEEKLRLENSLKFFYYTPKLKKILQQHLKVNKYQILDQQDDKCFFMITSTSKTSIQNFENETKKLTQFNSENWKELSYEMNYQLSQKIEDTCFINQLSTSHTQFLTYLKNWEIPDFKPYFFQINSKQFINKAAQYQYSLQMVYTFLKPEKPFKQIQNMVQSWRIDEYKAFNQFKDISPQSIQQQSEFNIVVFLSPSNEIDKNSIPIFYLYFTKS